MSTTVLYRTLTQDFSVHLYPLATMNFEFGLVPRSAYKDLSAPMLLLMICIIVLMIMLLPRPPRDHPGLVGAARAAVVRRAAPRAARRVARVDAARVPAAQALIGRSALAPATRHARTPRPQRPARESRAGFTRKL